MSDPGPFRPAPWARGPNAQTLFAYLARPRPRLHWRPERLELPDGDFVDLAHLGAAGPIVCLFHGLEGSLSSHYVGGLARNLVAAGLRVTFMHFRGCSGEPNRLPRAYHSGDTGDIRYLVDTLRRRDPNTPLAAVGFSLGGNALLKYLGEREANTPLAAALAVSVPFDLDACATRIDSGFSRVYQARLVRQMQQSTRARASRLGSLPIDMEAMARARSFREFDDAVTAPLHGFADARDYYARASSAPYLSRIAVPARLIQARDDPFVGPGPVPSPDDVAPAVELDVSDHGGHVGFVAARNGLPLWWLEHSIPVWFRGALRDGPGPARQQCVGLG